MSDLDEERSQSPNWTPAPTGRGKILGEGVCVKILVVDDVGVNREILRRWLVRRGFQVFEACDGIEALEVVAHEVIDLILLDVMMPRLGGVEVVRAIRSSGSNAHLPIIMVSAKSLSEDISHCIEAGANDYITKPVDFTLMLTRINEQLENKIT